MTVLPSDARENLASLVNAAYSGQQAALATIDKEWVPNRPDMLLMGLVELRTAQESIVCLSPQPKSCDIACVLATDLSRGPTNMAYTIPPICHSHGQEWRQRNFRAVPEPAEATTGCHPRRAPSGLLRRKGRQHPPDDRRCCCRNCEAVC